MEGRGLYFEKDSCGFSGGGKEASSPTNGELSLGNTFSLPTPELERTRPFADLG